MTQRELHKRKLQRGDADEYHRLTGNEEVMRWITGKAHTREQSQSEVERLVARFGEDPHAGIWMFFDHEQAFVGVGALMPEEEDIADVEIGYRVLQTRWKQGYGTAIVRQILALSQAKTVVAKITKGNVASARLIEASGFVLAPPHCDDLENVYIFAPNTPA